MHFAASLLLLLCGWQCRALHALTHQEPLGDGTLRSRPHLTHDLLGFHKNITEIESITYNEQEIGAWMAASLESQGFSVEKQFVDEKAGRFNVYAYPGEKRKTNVLISSHIDTVPPFLPYKRFKNGTIFGRGSVDDKASVAAQLIAVNTLLSADKISPDDVALLFVVGEETGGDGMRAANGLNLKPQAVIFGEPTELKLVAGHKGNLAFKLQAKGRAAHSGYPWLGRSANEILVTVLAALMELAPNLPRSEKYGQTTINLGRIEGGVAPNVVAESASARISVRLAAGTPNAVKDEITRVVHLAVQSFLEEGADPEDIIELEWSSGGYGPVDLDYDVPGFDSLTVNYGTDVPWFEKTVKGQKRYLYGPGTIFVAHSDHEALTEDDLYDAVDGYQKIILHALGKS